MQYTIYEGNMERLEKKLTRIYNKCQKYGCDFHFEQVGETFKEVEDEKGNKQMARFIIVEAEGKAIVNDWEFAASVEHTDNGNIFTGKQDIEIPERYYTGEPVCEHCKTNRYRKYTYIIRNSVTGEFKQVGKACLKDFTHGMSVEAVAQYISLFDNLIEGEAPYPGSYIEDYLDVKEYLAYAAETIRHFGYVKSGDERNPSTGSRALDFYKAARGRAATMNYLEYLRQEMDKVKFDINHPDTVKTVEDALKWIEDQSENSNYIHNLKTVCGLKYTKYKNYGLLASLFPAYDRGLEKAAKHKEEHGSDSVHVGEIGGKITMRMVSVKCVTGWDTEYGYMHIWKMVGEDGNIYTWKTTKGLDEDADNQVLSGMIKDHTEFRGVKQTELTRCFVSRA